MASFNKKTVGALGSAVVSIAPSVAPGPAAGILRKLADYAIDGAAGLPGARTTAGHTLESKSGDVEAAIDSLVRNHITMSGAQGFVTNLGGVLTAIAAIPANLAAVSVIQTRMVASIAHLRGYDVDDPRVREAIWMTLLGRKDVDHLVEDGKLPSTPLGVATAPVNDAALEQQIAEQVLAVLLSRSGGKQTAALLAKRIPGIGGGVGLATDSWFTWQVAKYARTQFVTRRVGQINS